MKIFTDLIPKFLICACKLTFCILVVAGIASVALCSAEEEKLGTVIGIDLGTFLISSMLSQRTPFPEIPSWISFLVMSLLSPLRHHLQLRRSVQEWPRWGKRGTWGCCSLFVADANLISSRPPCCRSSRMTRETVSPLHTLHLLTLSVSSEMLPRTRPLSTPPTLSMMSSASLVAREC